jgi:hypothetical protein
VGREELGSARVPARFWASRGDGLSGDVRRVGRGDVGLAVSRKMGDHDRRGANAVVVRTVESRPQQGR